MKLSCMETSVANLEEYNPWTAAMMNNLAKTYMLMKRTEEAEKLFQKSLHVKTSILGPEDEEVATTNAALGYFYWTMGGHQNQRNRVRPDIQPAEAILRQHQAPLPRHR